MDKKAAKKQQILQAAVEAFGRSNFEDASISEIARRAGVAEGTIYQYFKNKQDLFFSIPREKTKVFTSKLDGYLEGISDTRDKIRKFVWYYLYFFTTNPAYARSLMLEMRISRAFAKSSSYKGIKKFTNQALEILREGQERGIIRKDVDIYLARHLLLGILEHVVTRWLLKGEKDDIIQHYGQVSDIILNGIGVRSSDEAGRSAR
ncbi:MAG TPA: TetR/AcrR family transcriptional regulator [Syntrophorhabdales bacterium]|nr:TetR/AcrR family transcriptional regulator [Syntrophorhabdales bacterium]